MGTVVQGTLPPQYGARSSVYTAGSQGVNTAAQYGASSSSVYASNVLAPGGVKGIVPSVPATRADFRYTGVVQAATPATPAILDNRVPNDDSNKIEVLPYLKADKGGLIDLLDHNTDATDIDLEDGGDGVSNSPMPSIINSLQPGQTEADQQSESIARMHEQLKKMHAMVQKQKEQVKENKELVAKLEKRNEENEKIYKKNEELLQKQGQELLEMVKSYTQELSAGGSSGGTGAGTGAAKEAVS